MRDEDLTIQRQPDFGDFEAREEGVGVTIHSKRPGSDERMQGHDARRNGGTCAGPAAAAGDLVESIVQITTEDGVADFFIHPANGTHPDIVMWPDMAGTRSQKDYGAQNGGDG